MSKIPESTVATANQSIIPNTRVSKRDGHQTSKVLLFPTPPFDTGAFSNDIPNDRPLSWRGIPEGRGGNWYEMPRGTASRLSNPLPSLRHNLNRKLQRFGNYQACNTSDRPLVLQATCVSMEFEGVNLSTSSRVSPDLSTITI